MKLPLTRRSRIALGAGASVAALSTLYAVGLAHQDDQDNSSGKSASGTICVEQLPPEAQDTIQDILRGGPYDYDQDGTVFKNREDALPQQKAGYYHEFTVKTPGLSHRGTKRIVTGGDIKDQVDDHWTGDHYRSFKLVDYHCGGKGDGASPGATASEPVPGKGGPTAQPPEGTDLKRVGVTCESTLNDETRETIDLIAKNGPFPYPKKDGSTFDWRPNDKYPFPQKADGYYREYTVPTPGLSNRGRQRIVTGGEPTDKVEDYYTSDHYETFELVDYDC